MPHGGLILRGIVKTFPGVKALDDAALDVRAGEIHGLIGENGAGKSTIIKVLAGVYQPDAGEIVIDGRAVASLTPEAVHDAGIRFIHQELHLVPHFTVAESVFLGQEQTTGLGLAKRQMSRAAEQFLKDKLNVTISGGRLVRDLGPAERKLVQIARALIDDAARVVVFDEPTAPLSSEEIDTLMTAIRRLRERGIAILYVSHYLNEIIDLCDRVTVFRQGRTVSVFETVDKGSAPALVAAMVGRELVELPPHQSRSPGAPLLDVRNLGDDDHFRDVSFTLRRGEIVGIAGLIGSGREALIDALYGLRRVRRGSLEVEGSPVRLASPAHAVERGIVLVPRDRRHDGLVLSMTAGENINLATLDQVSVAGLEVPAKARQAAAEQIINLDIRPPDPGAVARFLSGGNQQKVVLARWLSKSASVFLMDEPTVGVDVGAKVEIYQLIDRLAEEGAGVIVSSSDPAELIRLCDRIMVMMRGRVQATLPAKGLQVDDLVAATTGAREAADA